MTERVERISRKAMGDKAGVMTDALAAYCTRKGRLIIFIRL
jgi:hypothetical protein